MPGTWEKMGQALESTRQRWLTLPKYAWLAIRSKADKAARRSPKDRKHAALSSYRRQLDQDIPAVKITAAFRYVFRQPFRMEMSPDPFLRRGKHGIVTQMEQAACRMAAMSSSPSK